MARVLPLVLQGSTADRLSVLFDTHYDRLYRLARRLAQNGDDARDLVQETFLKAARSLRSVPLGTSAEEAWLVRVLINVSHDLCRKAAVRRRYRDEIAHPARVGNDQEAVLVARATVWRALDRLTPRRRAVVIMYELEGLTTPAIASLLGISGITVRWHLSVGRQELARILGLHRGERR